MRNLLVTIAYDGTDYHGWQVQPNGITVQQAVQDAIEKILGKRENIVGCSRTDSGVHANNFCFNMRTESPIDPFRFVGAMNAVLPDDIAVKECVKVPMEFHARYDCKGKEYIYKIWNSPQRNPFLQDRYLHYKKPLDAELLNKAAQAFVGKHDFSAFCASKTTVEDFVRTVEYAAVTQNDEEVCFTVKADGFLYNMVRIMVGTLLEVAEGRISADSIGKIINSLDRNQAGRTAPAHGLYLNKVFY
ncbi:MAG: tRNA pseudouridine(38-40) synthase TruA [Clostridia bacterium]|nr:tRNA pseudouridine(38-40) synthase TruA [Clostridia bacterium]